MTKIWRPFTQMSTASPPLHVDRGEGAKLYLKDGRTILDAISSWWVITHGHNHPAIMQAIRDQTHKLDQVIFAGFTHDPAEELADRLLKVAGEPFEHVFFSDDGSTSVEVALKMALQAQTQRGQSQRKGFIAFQEAYHGDTVGSMSVGGSGPFTDPYKPMLFPVWRCEQGRTSKDPLERWTEPFLKTLNEVGEQAAAVILEPLVQGAGGMIMWPKEAVKIIVEAAKKAGLLVIFDEVMTGFGRTGQLFAYQKLGLEPDIFCVSKGLTAGSLPLALTLTHAEVYKAFLDESKARMFFHGHSFTGNPLSCAASVANLKLLETEDAETNWQRIEHIHRMESRKFIGQPQVADVRICGTIAAVEVRSDSPGYLANTRTNWAQKSLDQGVLLRPLGNVLYILPPWCMTDEELRHVWQVLASCVFE